MAIPGFATHPDISANLPQPPVPSGLGTGRLLSQYNRMKKLLNAELSQGSIEGISDIIEIIVSNLSFVNITLKDPSVAPKIFERLNARAEPITIADLVRNEVFLLTSDDPERAQQIFTNYWEPFAKRFEETSDGLEKFLFPYGLIGKHSITKRELFSHLRSYWQDFAGPRDIIDDMSNYVNAFMALEAGILPTSLPGPLKTALSRISRLGKPSSTYAFIMRLVYAESNDEVAVEEATNIIQVIEDFLFRRAVCGIEPTGLHAVFKGMWSELSGADDGTGDLSGITAGSVRQNISSKPTIAWPNDEEFINAIKKLDLYHRRVAKFALREFEVSSYGETPSDDFEIEHILPQRPTDEWKKKFKNEWESVVNTWANLLPVTDTMNQELSRSPYEIKRNEFQGSMFATTRNLASDVDDWSLETLAERAESIANWALERWPTTRA